MDQVYVRCSVQVFRSILDHKQQNIFSLKFSHMINLSSEEKEICSTLRILKHIFYLECINQLFAASDWDKSLENKSDLVDNLD